MRVWNTGKWEREAVLTGHQLAVTSVDWKNGWRPGVILVSCSDDRDEHFCTQSTILLLLVMIAEAPSVDGHEMQ